MGPCGQWSSAHPWLGTLVRHVLCAVGTMTMAGTGAVSGATLPPAPGPLGMRQATTP